MFQRDYILRLVEQFVQALTHILGLKQSGRIEEAEQKLKEVCRTLAGLEPEALVLLPLAGILQLLRGGEARGQSVEVERGAMLARLLKEHGELCEARGNLERARGAWVKAFVLYDELAKHATGDELDAHQETITWLTERL